MILLQIAATELWVHPKGIKKIAGHSMSESCTDQVLLCGYPPFFGETDADVLAKAVERCNKTCFQRLLSSIFPSMKHLKFLGRCDWATSTSILQTGKTCRIPLGNCCSYLLLAPLPCYHVPMLPIHQFQLGRHTQHRSDDAKSLIRWMLKMNPRDRYTAEHRPQCQECRIWYFIYIYIQRFVDHHDKSAKEIRQTKLCRQALNHEWIKNKAPRAQSVSLTQLDCMLTGLRRCIGRPETNLVEQEASNVHSEGTAIFAIPLFFSQFVVAFFQER